MHFKLCKYNDIDSPNAWILQISIYNTISQTRYDIFFFLCFKIFAFTHLRALLHVGIMQPNRATHDRYDVWNVTTRGTEPRRKKGNEYDFWSHTITSTMINGDLNGRLEIPLIKIIIVADALAGTKMPIVIVRYCINEDVRVWYRKTYTHRYGKTYRRDIYDGRYNLLNSTLSTRSCNCDYRFFVGFFNWISSVSSVWINVFYKNVLL